jgi:hypothetical protein
MNYKIGYKTKPESISQDGLVTFTDGTNSVPVNQITCEAYGYRYNAFNGTCEVKNLGSDLREQFAKRENKISGVNNKIEAKSRNININGINNTVKGQSSNALIIGDNNTISNGVNNVAILSGSGANAIRTGEVIVGGSLDEGLNDISGNITNFRTQTSRFHMTGRLDTGQSVVYTSLSGLDGIFGIPMSINSLTVLEATVIASKAGTALYHMEKLTCIATCNASGVTDVNSITKNVVNSQIGNTAIGADDGKTLNTFTGTTLYNENEVYIAFVNELLGGGAVSNITISVSINLVEQIHDYNTNITTNS